MSTDRNFVILDLLKINVNIKSDIDRIWKERHDFVWWNLVKKSRGVRPHSHDEIFSWFLSNA